MNRVAFVLSFLLILSFPAKTSSPRPAPGLAERFSNLADAPSRAALDAAFRAYSRAVNLGNVANQRYLTVIDYTLPSAQRRLWVLDVERGAIVRHELVAHGKGSGDASATQFSNRNGSLMTSLGLFVTDHTYRGSHGYSLRLRGLDPGVNDNAYDRAIVIHGADYVSELIAKTGRLGRSWGCPAVSNAVVRSLIDIIRDGTVLFAFGPQA